MNISHTAYEALSPRQRLIAAIDAIARMDWAELDQLKTTCPLKTYRREDTAFRDVMEALLAAGMGVEVDLLGAALWFFACPDPERCEAARQDIAAIEAAWLDLLADMGITSPTAAPLRHPLVSVLLENAPEPDPEKVAEFYAQQKASASA